MKYKRSIDSHLKQLIRHADRLCDLGDLVSSEEFFIGIAGALLASKGIVNGREKIGRKKQIKESDNRSSKKRRVETIEGDWKETD